MIDDRIVATGEEERLTRVKHAHGSPPVQAIMTEGEFDRCFAGCTPSPYMVIAASASPLGSERLRGVVHVDGTSRPQVVTAPGAYRDLLLAMGALSGPRGAHLHVVQPRRGADRLQPSECAAIRTCAGRRCACRRRVVRPNHRRGALTAWPGSRHVGKRFQLSQVIADNA
jgi:hypothetical protein